MKTITIGVLAVAIFAISLATAYEYGKHHSERSKLVSYRFVLLDDWKYQRLDGMRILTDTEVVMDSLILNGLLSEVKTDKRREMIFLKGQ